MRINISPVPSYPGTATQLDCVSMSVQLGTTANVVWRLLDVNNNVASINTSTNLTEEQYNGWTGDDAYVLECIAENVGLTPL